MMLRKMPSKQHSDTDTNEVTNNSAAINELAKIMFELDQKVHHFLICCSLLVLPMQSTSRNKGFVNGGKGRKKGPKSAETKINHGERCSFPSDSGVSRKAKVAGKKRNKKQKKSLGKSTGNHELSIPIEDNLRRSTELSAVELAEQLETATSDVIESPEPVVDLRQKRKLLQLARAEERRREIEKKRSELREMEIQRQIEETRKQQLLDNLAQEAKRQVEKVNEQENDFSVCSYRR